VSTQTELAFTQDELVSTGSELSLTQADLASTEESLATTEVELASTQGTLIATESTLALVQSTLDSTEEELKSVQDELASAHNDLTSTQADLVSTQTDLASAEDALAASQWDLTDLQSELSDVQQCLSDAEQELEVAQSTLGGLGITLSTSERNYEVSLVDSSDAVNPSWSELLAFLADDQTEDHEYIAGVYDCSEFSRDVHNNAEAAGIRAAVVHDHFSNTLFDHSLNAFLTTDYGLVYIDCSGGVDTIARVERDKEYRAVETGVVSPSSIRDNSWWDGLALEDCFTIVAYWEADYSPVIAMTSRITIFW